MSPIEMEFMERPRSNSAQARVKEPGKIDRNILSPISQPITGRAMMSIPAESVRNVESSKTAARVEHIQQMQIPTRVARIPVIASIQQMPRAASMSIPRMPIPRAASSISGILQMPRAASTSISQIPQIPITASSILQMPRTTSSILQMPRAASTSIPQIPRAASTSIPQMPRAIPQIPRAASTSIPQIPQLPRAESMSRPQMQQIRGRGITMPIQISSRPPFPVQQMIQARMMRRL